MAAADKNTKSGFNAPAVVLGGLAALIFLYALSLFLQGGFLAAQSQQYDVKMLTPENEPLAAHRAEQQAILDEQARQVDETTGRWVMPVEDAMNRLAAGDAAAAGGTKEVTE